MTSARARLPVTVVIWLVGRRRDTCVSPPKQKDIPSTSLGRLRKVGGALAGQKEILSITSMVVKL